MARGRHEKHQIPGSGREWRHGIRHTPARGIIKPLSLAAGNLKPLTLVLEPIFPKEFGAEQLGFPRTRAQRCLQIVNTLIEFVQHQRSETAFEKKKRCKSKE